MLRLSTVLALFFALFLSLPARAQEEPAPSAPALSADITFEQWKDLPDKVRYTPTGPIPPYYEHRRLIKKAMAITGGSILGGVYLFSTLPAAYVPELWPLLIPVVGPWMAIYTSGAPTQTLNAGSVWWLTMTGLAQGTGLVLFVWGLTDKDDWLVKRPYGFASLQVVPSVGPQFTGGFVIGRF